MSYPEETQKHAEIVVRYECEQKYASKFGLTLKINGSQRFEITDGGRTFDLTMSTIQEVESFLEGFSRAKEIYSKKTHLKENFKEGDLVIVNCGVRDGEKGCILGRSKEHEDMWDVRLKNERVIVHLPEYNLTLDKRGKR